MKHFSLYIIALIALVGTCHVASHAALGRLSYLPATAARQPGTLAGLYAVGKRAFSGAPAVTQAVDETVAGTVGLYNSGAAVTTPVRLEASLGYMQDAMQRVNAIDKQLQSAQYISPNILGSYIGELKGLRKLAVASESFGDRAARMFGPESSLGFRSQQLEQLAMGVADNALNLELRAWDEQQKELLQFDPYFKKLSYRKNPYHEYDERDIMSRELREKAAEAARNKKSTYGWGQTLFPWLYTK